MKWFGRDKRTPGEGQSERIHDDVRAARQSRLTQTATRRDLVNAISAALFKADPVGINFDTNTDEYDAEAETIVIALPRAAGPEDVRSLTHETFVQWFDAETAGPIERYTAVAHEIWTLWRRHEGQSEPTG
ncbi:hypothetical protein [Knoellia sp. Soil729]|uniref:hypothetical protein n=1 Tax=Knoellia sp. Soil729 TaxID=1736394 RepID=UPI000A8BC6CC|nr:hypothetical protein [Knoellia sp. Soil729]